MSQEPPTTESAAAEVLSALDPLLQARDAATVKRTIAAIRATNAPPAVLATALYTFSKLVLQFPESVDPFREVVDTLVSTAVLPRDALYESIDHETHKLLEPQFEHAVEEKRCRTRLWFTQTRYNLFREESEGYAKLIALMWDIVSAPDSVKPDDVADALLALIGQFHLDSNRVIELILSAAVDVLFGTAPKNDLPVDRRLPPLFVRLLDEFARDHVFSVVGAMLQCYHAVPASAPSSKETASTGAGKKEKAPSVDASPSQNTAQPESKLPNGFFGLIAVLMREGRIRIADVWPSLSPRDDRELIQKFIEYEKQLDALSKRVGSSSVNRPPNPKDPAIFARSGTGPSERDIFSQYIFVNSGPFSRFSCQKLDFIFMLIGMCRWDDAMEAILSLGVDDEHVDIAAHPSIGGPLAGFVEILLCPVLHTRFPSLYPERASVTKAIADLGGRANRYPSLIKSVDELVSSDQEGPGAVVRQMLFVLGPHARTKPGLLHGLCRLLKGRSEPEAIEIMQAVILPSFSLLQSNIGLGEAIWDVLRSWPHTKRWRLYGHLHNVISNTCAVYQVVARRASFEMKYVLNRLTSETLKQHTMTITKIAYGQALPVFSAALDRIQGYPPDAVTISPVVEACRDCSELAIDMLLYLVVDRMADSGRRRLKEDGINIAQWYATLSLFLGLSLRKLHVNSQHVEGVLSFFCKKLVSDREALLITALSDVIHCVADIEVESNLTAKQISAQGGGRHIRAAVSGIWGRLQPDLKMVGLAFDQKLERDKKSAMIALLSSFERTEMHVSIAVAIAQLTRESVYHEEVRSMPLKLGANIVDRARTSLQQLSEFMDTMPPNAARAAEIRSDVWRPLRDIGLANLVDKMGVPTSAAVVILSPALNYLADCKKADGGGAKLAIKPNEVTSDMKASSLGRATGSTSETLKTDQREAKCKNMKDADGDVKMESAVRKDIGSGGIATDADDSAGKARRNSTSTFADIISKRTQNLVSPELARAFWTLKLDDIAVPVQLYESESKRLHAIKAVWEKEVERLRRLTHSELERRRAESEYRKIRDIMEDVDEEKLSFVRKSKQVLDALRANRMLLCSSGLSTNEEEADKFVSFFLQECVFPRCRVSVCDAIFCSRFVLLLLELDVRVMNYAKYFEGLLKLIPIVLSSCSENEAFSIARLVKEVLTVLEKWRSNRKVFDSEASSGKKHGFRDSVGANSNPMRHEQYCQWLFDIHGSLAEGLCVLLKSDEYLHSRNSLSVLAGIADVFPKVSEHSTEIEEHVVTLCSSDLPDIRLSSAGFLARLRSGKVKRLPEHIFKLKPSSGGSANAAGNGRSQKKARQGDQSRAPTADKDGKSGTTASASQQPKRELRPAAASSGVNGTTAPNGPPKNVEQKQNLNPKAKEFVLEKGSGGKTGPKVEPSKIGAVAKSNTDKSSSAPTNVGKRARDEKSEAVPVQGPGRNPRTGSTAKPRSPDSAPPLKKPRGEDKQRGGETGQKPVPSDGRIAAVKARENDGPTSSRQRNPVKGNGQKPAGAPKPDTSGREPTGRDSAKEAVSRDGTNRSAQPRGAPSRNAGARLSPGHEQAPRNSIKRDAPQRGNLARDVPSRGSPKRVPVGREAQNRDGGGRAPVRENIARDAPGREAPNRGGPNRNGSHRDSPIRKGPRAPPGRDNNANRDVGAGPAKDTGRRRRSNDPPQSGYQYGPSKDHGGPMAEGPDYDDGHGAKRRREYPQRNAASFDGEARRPGRQRVDDGSYRDRPGSRDDGGGINADRRFSGPGSPARDSGRFEGNYGGSGPGPKWDQGRPRSGHDGANEARGGGGGGPAHRRRDHGKEYENRDRPPPRGREDGRGEGDFGGYEDRGGSRGGYRDAPPPPRRGGGRREEPRREGNYRRTPRPRRR